MTWSDFHEEMLEWVTQDAENCVQNKWYQKKVMCVCVSDYGENLSTDFMKLPFRRPFFLISPVLFLHGLYHNSLLYWEYYILLLRILYYIIYRFVCGVTCLNIFFILNKIRATFAFVSLMWALQPQPPAHSRYSVNICYTNECDSRFWHAVREGYKFS